MRDVSLELKIFFERINIKREKRKKKRNREIFDQYNFNSPANERVNVLCDRTGLKHLLEPQLTTHKKRKIRPDSIFHFKNMTKHLKISRP